MSQRQVCLAIGIGDAGGGLEYLGGALNAARGMHDWALALGYESTLLTDEVNPVDVPQLRRALEKLLPQGSSTHRLILYFAGHGLIARADDGLWLLNDWHRDLRAVAIEVLKRRLRNFGVQQLTIVADACRKLPADMVASDLAQDPVLGAGFTRPLADPMIDRFTACQDGRASYMIPGRTPEEDRCLFSGVLLEGLWGLSDAAFSRRANGQVISTSLADYLRTEVPRVAARYRLQMDPQTLPGFPELDDVYFDRAHPPAARAKLGPWPTPRNKAIERVVAESGAVQSGESATGSGLGSVLGSLLSGAAGTGALGTAAEGLRGLPVTEQLSALITPKSARRRRGGPSQPVQRPGGFTEAEWEALKALATLESNVPLDEAERRQIAWLAERGALAAQARAAAAASQAQQTGTLDLIRSAQVPEGLLEGLVVAGGTVARLWGGPDLVLTVAARPPVWAAASTLPFEEARQVVIEFDDGRLAPCTLMSGMVTRVAVDAQGIAALVMQPGYDQYDEITRSIDASEHAIAKLAGGKLGMQEATDLATTLRMIKHVNPVLGVLSAYLYDAIGDMDSIRRMASYYLQHHQSVPFDIVFLADLPGRDRGDGVLQVEVPALPRRQPRTTVEASFPWTTEATPAIQGLVAGRLPWLRRGWPYVAAPTDPERVLTTGVPALMPALTASLFTSFESSAQATLIDLLDLELRI
jgi:Caspase domain